MLTILRNFITGTLMLMLCEDPRNHILYHAAVVLGYDEDFQQDIDDYLNRDVD